MVANPLPALDFFAPPVTPQGFGLYAAANITDSGETIRHQAGVNIWPYNCGGASGTYSTDLCDDSPATKVAARGGPNDPFDPLFVWGADECATDQTEAEVMGRARQNRVLNEPLLVESAFATRLLADAGAPAVAASLLEAIGMVEVWLGERGFTGYIHASRKWAVLAGDMNATLGGAALRTNLGNTWVFGGGYDSVLGDTIVASSQPFIWRSTPFEQVVTTGSSVVGAHNNSRYAISERVIVAGYECDTYAVTIDTTP